MLEDSVVTNAARMSLSAARAAIAAAEREAAERGLAVVVAVVDDGGNLVSFDRMDRAPLLSLDFAADKAWTAAAFGRATDEWWSDMSTQPALAATLPQRPRFVAVGVGVPLWIGDTLVGGVGVSGGSVADDIACAQAGQVAFAGQLPATNGVPSVTGKGTEKK